MGSSRFRPWRCVLAVAIATVLSVVLAPRPVAGVVHSPFTWTYEPPLDDASWWPEWYPDCATGDQSPIDIVRASVQVHNSFVGFQGLQNIIPSTVASVTMGKESPYNCPRADIWPENLQYRIQWPLQSDGTPSPGGLVIDETYTLDNIAVRTPSEHLFDGVAASGEIQMVFMANKPPPSGPVSGSGSGTPVDTIIVVQPFNNVMMWPDFVGEGQVTTLISSTEVILKSIAHHVTLSFGKISFTFPSFPDGFYFYTGSLTYPPCTPGVKYLVSTSVVDVSNTTYTRILDLMPSTPPVRSAKPLNTRDVLQIRSREVRTRADSASAPPNASVGVSTGTISPASVLMEEGVLLAGLLAGLLLVVLSISFIERQMFKSPHRSRWFNPHSQSCVFGSAPENTEVVEEASESEDVEMEQEEEEASDGAAGRDHSEAATA